MAKLLKNKFPRKYSDCYCLTELFRNATFVLTSVGDNLLTFPLNIPSIFMFFCYTSAAVEWNSFGVNNYTDSKYCPINYITKFGCINLLLQQYR